MRMNFIKTIILIVFIAFIGTTNVSASICHCEMENDSSKYVYEIDFSKSDNGNNYLARYQVTQKVNLGLNPAESVPTQQFIYSSSGSCPASATISSGIIFSSGGYSCHEEAAFTLAEPNSGSLHLAVNSNSNSNISSNSSSNSNSTINSNTHSNSTNTGNSGGTSSSESGGSNSTIGEDVDRLHRPTRDTLSCGTLTGIPKSLPKITSILYLVLQILVPIILVVVGSIDLVKAMTAQKDDEIKRGQQVLVKRLIAAGAVFFICAIVRMLSSYLQDSTTITDCMNCFISGKCGNQSVAPDNQDSTNNSSDNEAILVITEEDFI